MVRSFEDMSELTATTIAPRIELRDPTMIERPDHIWRRLLSNGRFLSGGILLLLILGACVVSLKWTGRESLGVDEDGYPVSNPYYFDAQDSALAELPPSRDSLTHWFGTDTLGRSILMRSLF